QPLGLEPAEASDDVGDVLTSLDRIDTRPPRQQAPADDVPQWMREMAPSELRPTTPAPAESPASDSGSELDWLSSVDIPETPAGAPSNVQPQSGMSTQPKAYSEMPPELAAEIDNLDLEKKVGSSDIDSLLHLSSAESLAISRTDQQPSALVAPQQEI